MRLHQLRDTSDSYNPRLSQTLKPLRLRYTNSERKIMLDGTLAKVFGTKHEREIKRIRPLVSAIIGNHIVTHIQKRRKPNRRTAHDRLV